MASEDNTFRPEASSQTVPQLLSQLTETWKKHEEYLLQKVTDLEYKLTKKREDYDQALIHSDLRHKEEIQVLKKKIEGLEDEVKKKVDDIDEMKKVNDQYTKKIRVNRNMFLDYDVRVLNLEKLGNELKGSGCSSVDFEAKKPKNVAAGIIFLSLLILICCFYGICVC